MANLMYQKIWKLFNDYNFEIDLHLFSDFICVICKKLIQNAYQSPCGCRYCLQCIESYLCGIEKCCPRGIDDCKDQMINLERNLQCDHVANKKISLIKVKCPKPLCFYTDELRNMTEHIDSHKMRCPYVTIGCSKPTIDMNTMADHINSDSLTHIMLLMNSINNLKNDIYSIKEDLHKKELIIDEVKMANSILKEEVAINKRHHDQFKRKTDEEIRALKSGVNMYDNECKRKQMIMNIANREDQTNGLFEEGDQTMIKIEQEQQEQSSEEIIEFCSQKQDAMNFNVDRNDNMGMLTANCFLDQSRSMRNESLKIDCAPFTWQMNNLYNNSNSSNNNNIVSSHLSNVGIYNNNINNNNQMHIDDDHDFANDSNGEIRSVKDQKRDIIHRIWLKKNLATKKNRRSKSLHSLLEEELPSEGKDQLMKKSTRQLTKAYYYILSKNKIGSIIHDE